MSEFKLVRVRFYDAQSSDEWEDIEKKVKFPIVESVGYLIPQNENCVSLVPTIDRVNEKACGRMDIPRGAIQDIHILTVGRKVRANAKL